jgi:hypothetical protein
MRLLIPLALLCSFPIGCQLPPEHAPPKPLAEDSPPLPFAGLSSRARQQATSATESFYMNAWSELEENARGLEQTARFLPKATEVPATRKDKLSAAASDLEKDAQELRNAAKDKDVNRTNAIMQRINLKVRALQPEK